MLLLLPNYMIVKMRYRSPIIYERGYGNAKSLSFMKATMV
jgi:hypothetical protein